MRKRAAHLGTPAGVHDDGGDIVGQHAIAAAQEGREQRGLADAPGAREQHRSPVGPDRAGVQGETPALLQARSQHGTEQKGGDRAVAVRGGSHHDLAPPLPDQVAGRPVHVQQEPVRRGLPTFPGVSGITQGRRHRAYPDGQIGLGLGAGLREGCLDLGTDAQAVGAVVVDR